MTFSSVNYVAILVAAMAGWLAGAAWYMVLGKHWMAALGITPEMKQAQMQKPGALLPFIGVALVFGIVNAVIRPILKFFTFPLFILTFGLFAFVVNGLMLWLTSSLSGALGLSFRVSGFKAAFIGAVVVSLVSTLLGILIRERDED